ncbi:MAG: response regulator [Roseinatronobacter sp.]|nr:MAG: response regulator [Roseinatronobacter sp.]
MSRVTVALPKAALAGLALAALALCLIGLASGGATPASLAALTTGLSLLVLAGVAWAVRFFDAWQRRRDHQRLDSLLGDAGMACILADSDTGAVEWCNSAAFEHFNLTPPQKITTVLSDLHADPDGFVTRLQDLASLSGRADHRLKLQNSERVYRVEKLGDGQFLWRIALETQADTRDALPFEFAQFQPDGRLDYISPALRQDLSQNRISIDQLFQGTPPPHGQIAPVTLSAAGIERLAIRLESQGAATETVLFLPSQHGLDMPEHSIKPGETRHLQNLPVGLAHITLDGQLTYVNDEARRLLRLRDTYLPVLSDALEGLGRPVLEWIADIASGRMARSTEVLRLNCTLNETYLKVTLTTPPREGVNFIVAVFSDVTELKSLEAKFTQSQKMQAIGQLAGGVAHDFNNLLTAISGHCDLLLLRHDRSDLNYPDLMQIQQNTNRAAALVRQLLALSRQQTLKFVTLDLQETMDDVIHLLNRLVGEKVTLSLRHGENVAPIRSDKRQFEQVLMNLVVNARDALPMGGEIRIETASCALPKGLIRENVQLPAGNYTLIKISDDGIGIPQPLLGKVFDPFFTTKRQGEGTGLGLSTVYGIVKQSGGYVFIESEEGVGTTFTLYFAAQTPEPASRDLPKREGLHSSALQSRHALILLVEDETPVRSFAARALELQGHRVIEADCGEAALDILQDPSIVPDCFVTDVIMPGLDGPSWIAQIRPRFPDTPVVFMSGYAEDSRVAAQARISNATFLGKPFSLVEFTQTVHAQLRLPTEMA